MDVNIRAGYKSYCTRTSADLEKELALTLPDIISVQSKVSILEEQLNKIEKLTFSILPTLDSADVAAELAKELDYQSKIKYGIAAANIYLTSVRPNTATVQSVFPNANNSGINATVKLPVLHLNKFNDTILGWSTFWDSFASAVDSKTDLKPAQKFIYLKGLLQGDSLVLVDRLPVDDASYSVAVDILKQTYDNRVVGLISQVQNLQALKLGAHSLIQVRKFRAEFESCIAGLEMLKFPIKGVPSAEAIVVALVLIKIPRLMRENMTRTAGDDILSLDNFRRALKIELDLLCTSTDEPNQERSVEYSTKNSSVGSKSGVKSGTSESTVGSFSVSAGNNNKSNNNSSPKGNNSSNRQAKSNAKSNKGKYDRSNIEKYCHFCDMVGHSSGTCTTYPDFKARIDRLQSMGNRCNICWFRKHGKQPCVKLYCRVCKGDHWSALCTKVGQTDVNINHISNSGHNAVALPTLTAASCDYNYTYRALVDQGSQRTLVLRSTVAALGIPVFKKESLSLSGFGSVGKNGVFDIVQFRMGRMSSPIQVTAIVVDALPKITMEGIQLVAEKLSSRSIPLADCKLQSSVISDIDILIGNDLYYEVVLTDQVPISCDGIWLLPTRFGYCITGRLPVQSGQVYSSNAVVVLHVATQETPWSNEVLPSSDVDKLWLLDNIGIVGDSRKTSDDVVLDNFNKSITHENGHYTVTFPWKVPRPGLPTNYALSKGRLNSLLKRLDKDHELRGQYDQVIKEQVRTEFIERVPHHEIVRPDVHYLPHQPVIKIHPTTPVRVVMDCSAKVKGSPSLNDCLTSGPSLVPLLVQIILRLRCSRFICASDISKAFLRVGLAEQDRDFTRFLWRERYDDPSSPIVAYRFKVVLFGSTSSPFLLQATIAHHLDKIGRCDLARNLYVDNLQGTSDNDTALLSFYEDSLAAYSSAGLPLREWITNCPSLHQRIASDKLAPSDGKTDVSILGVGWSIPDDVFHVIQPSFSPPGRATKRSVLSDSGKIFDPLGLLVPVTSLARIFLQKLWKLGVDWDTILDGDSQAEWCRILEKLKLACKIVVPRWVVKSRDAALHIFSDASNYIYGCCAYVVSDGSSKLIMAKARVAPIKELTIPKLELLGALISARVGVFLIEALRLEVNFTSIHLWVDSQIVLCWIKSKKEIKNLFVRNRVNEINRLMPTAEFHHIPGKDNCADILTKFKLDDLSGCKPWWHGPEFLVNQSTWPVMPEDHDYDTEDTNGVIPNQVAAINITVDEGYNEGLPDPRRFSRFSRLVNATGYIIRYKDILSNKPQDSSLTVNEVVTATNLWIKTLQGKWYTEEISYLQNKKGKVPQMVRQLWLFIEDGLIRVNSRLQYSLLSYNEKYPFLLPSNDYVTLLIIRGVHERLSHSSVAVTMSSLRNTYWIPKCRQVTRKALATCTFCRRFNVMKYNIPITPPLPSFRLRDTRCFQFTGVDLTGALKVKKYKDSEVTDKVYIVLFTCASSRAVHLELAEDCSAYAFAKVYRRFVARRSSPQLMLSDNATNFVGFVPQLQELQSHPTVKNVLMQTQTQWKFIPSRSPWMGGMWERMVGVTKRILYKVLGNTLVTYDDMLTIITEVEAKINDRPLTYISSNQDDCIPITPSHLMCGHRLDSLPIIVEDVDEEYDFNDPSNITRHHRRILDIIKQAWSLWKNEYVLALRERDRKNKPMNSKGEIIPHEGDVVCIIDDCPNSRWKLGRITELFKGTDGQVRVARVKTANGELNRPLVKLCHIESSEVSPMVMPNRDIPGETVNIDLSIRPKRKTALSAQSKISGWVDDDLV